MGSPYNDFAEERDQEEMSKYPNSNNQCSHCNSWSPVHYWDKFNGCTYCGHRYYKPKEKIK